MMRHVFVDTDVIIDFLGNRKPFSKYAVQLFAKAERGEYKLYTSGNSVTTAYYILCKSIPEKAVRELLPSLLNFVEAIPVTSKIILQSVWSDIKDFEDAVQHSCALMESKISCIVTRNLRDFKKSQLEVYSPEQLIEIN